MSFGCYELKIKCTNGDDIPIAVKGLKSITCPVDKRPFSVNQYPILKNFRVADTGAKNDETIRLDVLIGLDHYYSFVGYIAVTLSETLVLLDT